MATIAPSWRSSPAIIYALVMNGTLRFTELRRLVPKVSQRMLTQQLRDLERHGLVERVYHPQIPPRVEYGLKRDFQSPACEICLTRPGQITGWI